LSTYTYATDDKTFFDGLTGVNYQIDQINQKVRVLQNSSPSHREIEHRLHEIDDDIKNVKELYFEIIKNKSFYESDSKDIEKIKKDLEALTIPKIQDNLQKFWQKDDEITLSKSLLQSRDYTDKELDFMVTTGLALIGAILGVFTFVTSKQSNKTDELKKETEEDILDVVKEHKISLEKITDIHRKEISKLEKINLDTFEGAKTAFTNLVAESDMQNGLVYKNLAVSLYRNRYAIEENDDNLYFENQKIVKSQRKYELSVLHEIISIQIHALGRFNKVKSKNKEAEILFYESNLDLAFYEANLTKHGFLKEKAKKTILERLDIFLSNVERWVNIEKEHLEETKRLKRLTYRVVSSQESVIFILICMGEKVVNNSKEAIDFIKVESKRILEAQSAYNEELLDNLLSELNYDDWWMVYDNIKKYHPYIK
jgi:hypothetical protein